jgi:hypothetical protein
VEYESRVQKLRRMVKISVLVAVATVVFGAALAVKVSGIFLTFPLVGLPAVMVFREYLRCPKCGLPVCLRKVQTFSIESRKATLWMPNECARCGLHF